ncbi:hypothetical protein B0H16DRAFT_1815063 [Mycena metata]|uniref:Uncharacterized protein n=1 Tax=Mycena metata TaxID=1033252 RepID=A0AAD7J9F8_9AGAR|nr:hypothetical protein B0H16DRAFT_1815063 [Mycena metata]
MSRSNVNSTRPRHIMYQLDAEGIQFGRADTLDTSGLPRSAQIIKGDRQPYIVGAKEENVEVTIQCGKTTAYGKEIIMHELMAGVGRLSRSQSVTNFLTLVSHISSRPSKHFFLEGGKGKKTRTAEVSVPRRSNAMKPRSWCLPAVLRREFSFTCVDEQHVFKWVPSADGFELKRTVASHFVGAVTRQSSQNTMSSVYLFGGEPHPSSAPGFALFEPPLHISGRHSAYTPSIQTPPVAGALVALLLKLDEKALAPAWEL